MLRPSALASRVVEHELLVRAGAGDDAAAGMGRPVARRRRYAPRQPIRRARVRRETRRCSRVEGKDINGPVEVPATHAVAVRARRQSHHVALLGMRVQSRGFVGLQSSDAHFPIRRRERELAGSARGPRQSGHRVVLQELVADTFLVPPLETQLVHEHDVVALPDGELRGAGRERHAAHDEVLRAVALRGLRAELVTLRAGVVEHLHDAVGGHRGQALGVGAPVEGGGERVECRGGRVRKGRHGKRWGHTKSQRSDRLRCRSRGDAPCYRRDLLYALVRREDCVQVPELHGRRLHRVRLRSDDEGTSRSPDLVRREAKREKKKKRHRRRSRNRTRVDPGNRSLCEFNPGS